MLNDKRIPPTNMNLVEFQKPISEIHSHYNFGDPVTRENFAAVISDSFEKSQGSFSSQLMYFQYLKTNNIFDFKASFQNFISAGFSKAFSPQESHLLFNGFDENKAHLVSLRRITKNPEYIPSKEDFETGLNMIILQILREAEKDQEFPIYRMEFTDQTTFLAELKKIVQEERKIRRKERREKTIID